MDLRAKIDGWLEEGLEHYSAGDAARALEAWTKILDAEPTHALARQYVSYVGQAFGVQSNAKQEPKAEPRSTELPVTEKNAISFDKETSWSDLVDSAFDVRPSEGVSSSSSGLSLSDTPVRISSDALSRSPSKTSSKTARGGLSPPQGHPDEDQGRAVTMMEPVVQMRAASHKAQAASPWTQATASDDHSRRTRDLGAAGIPLDEIDPWMTDTAPSAQVAEDSDGFDPWRGNTTPPVAPQASWGKGDDAGHAAHSAFDDRFLLAPSVPDGAALLEADLPELAPETTPPRLPRTPTPHRITDEMLAVSVDGPILDPPQVLAAPRTATQSAPLGAARATGGESFSYRMTAATAPAARDALAVPTPAPRKSSPPAKAAAKLTAPVGDDPWGDGPGATLDLDQVEKPSPFAEVLKRPPSQVVVLPQAEEPGLVRAPTRRVDLTDFARVSTPPPPSSSAPANASPPASALPPSPPVQPVTLPPAPSALADLFGAPPARTLPPPLPDDVELTAGDIVDAEEIVDASIDASVAVSVEMDTEGISVDLDMPPVPPADGDDELVMTVVAGEPQADLAALMAELPVAPPPPPPPPAVEDIEELLTSARDLFSLGDFSGSLERIDKVLKRDPKNVSALAYLSRNESTLLKIYSSKIGDMAKVPRQLITPDEMIWMTMHHKAGFVLSQVDGTLSYEDILEICGMPRFDVMRILWDLVQKGVIG